MGKRRISVRHASTSHSGKACSSSGTPLILAMTIRRKVGVIATVVPVYKRRRRRFVSGEEAVADLKDRQEKKLPMAIKPSQKGTEPSLSQMAARREIEVKLSISPTLITTETIASMTSSGARTYFANRTQNCARFCGIGCGKYSPKNSMHN